MDVTFYFNASDERTINKNLLYPQPFVAEMIDEVNLMTPILMVEAVSIASNVNYCYIPLFRRYYSVVDWTAVSKGVWDVSLKEDVLMSFRGNILQLPCVVSKQTDEANGDEYIDDGSLVTDNLTFVNTYGFPSGFNENPTYILITAG